MSCNVEKPRHVRSFVRREGRITQSQQRALDDLLPRFTVPLDGMLDLDAVFGHTAPRTLEIGFGNGASLALMANVSPEQDFIGIEVHRPGIGHLLLEIERYRLSNLRVICADAVEILQQHIAPASLDRVLLYFPDPWPKTRHQKRRILQPGFVELIRERLKPDGVFHMATDWQNYAEQMLENMEAAPGFRNSAGAGQFSPKPDYRPETKFERRGLRLGHGVWDLIFTREPSQNGT